MPTNADDSEVQNFQGKRAQAAQYDAATTGLKAAAPWAVVSGAAVYAAHHSWPAFRRSLGVSGKLSLAIMPPFVAFNLVGEHTVLGHIRRTGDLDDEAAAPTREGPTWHLRAANAFMDHTLLSFGAIIAPMYAGILYHELSKPRYEGWKLSHAIIHTRVMGQAAAVASLVLTFGFKDFLRQMG
eukprot:CAMPEP_0119272364 /NCGR_PEP_ID=MMETSP1329-20130426/8575_1 /TAXON_ID=114041 /ORGANISM="Genus nov. species nov., Strain RCC1024" /LENGTH=182 /DNA_ID=CAMNT_0007272427 /DNA_START=179 /DNA_END=724 /DNA_ORIENTATION=+